MSWVSTMLRNWKGKGVDFFKTKMRPAINRQHNPFANFDWGDTNWSGLAGTATSMLGEGIDSAVGMNEKQKFYANSIANYGQGLYDNLSDNSSLIMAGMMPAMSTVEQRDIRDKTWGEDIGSSLMNGLNAGLSTGNPYIGIGVAALDFGNSLRERLVAKSTAEDLERQRRDRMRLLGEQYYAAAQGVDEQNDFNRLMSYFDYPYDFAFGGPLHSNGGDYNGGLTYIDEGGRHEENPYEGVPSGFDAEGNPNLVEEGEVIWNNEYVFSDRLKVPKELATKYKLGGKKDYTFAEAIEKLTKENTISPNDFITIATTKEIVNEFMDAQEAIRQEEQLAAREELETAQAQDFLAQLNAAQGMTPSMGTPIDLGQMGALPNEAPVTEGEMTPPGYAFGGNKFEGGGYKVVKVGNRYFITTEGAPKITGKMYGNQLVVDDQFKNLPSFNSFEKANREAERMRREALPALEYQSNISASGVTAHTGDKIIKRDTGEVDTNLKPIYEYVVADPNTGKTYRYRSYEAAAQKYSSIPRKVNDPRVRGGYAYVTPYGDIHINEKDAKDSLNKRMHPQNTSKGTAKTSQNKGIGTTAMAAEMPTNFNAQLDTALGVQDTLSVPALQQPLVTSSVQQMQAAQTATVPPSGSGAGTTKSTRRNANTGTRSATNVQTSTSRTLPEINSWDSLYSTLEGYTGSLGASAANGKYAIDRNSAYWNGRTAKEIESDEIHNQFSKWIKEHSSDPNVQKYFEYLDKGINKKSGAKTLLKYDKNGKPAGLADDWEATFDKRRGDGDLGIYHINPKNLDFLSEEVANSGTPESAEPFSDIKSTIGKATVGLIKNGVLTAPTIPSSKTTKTGATAQTTSITPPPTEPQFNYRDTRLRYAPVVGSAMATLYGMLNRPDYSNADRIIEAAYRMGTPINIPVETIGDYRRRNPFDERYLVNMANQNRAAAARGIANTAGGNRSMDLLGNMSLAHSNQQELGEIMRQAYLANRQDDAQVADFNRGTNVYNMNAINQRNLSQAQLNTHRQQAGLSGLTQGYGLRQSIKDNWDSATMESLNSMLASLGAIGKENEEYNILTSMAEQGYFPHYYRDRGIIDFVRPTKNGGKLNRKKRRF